MQTSSGTPLRILHIVAGAGRGGAETFCLDAVKALDEAGVKQHVICRPHDNYIEALRARGIPFDALSFGFYDRLRHGAAVIRRAAATFRPGVVHAWMGRAASLIPKDIDVPVLGWFGGYYDLKRYQNCDYYIGVSRDIVRHIAEKSGTPERVFLGHTFGTLEPQPPVDRRTLDTPPDAPVVLLLSRMHQKKGVDTLLRAAANLDGVYFWLAGEGPELAAYKKLSQELGLEGRVRFLGWRNDRAALLGSADVCVLPSRYEPFGTVIPEAWHMRVPLVATRAAGASQYVTHGKDGLLCDIDDVDGLAQQIKTTIADKNLRRTLVEQGEATYQALFSKDVVVKSLLETYGRIIEGGKKQAA